MGEWLSAGGVGDDIGRGFGVLRLPYRLLGE